jgi:hypothetical protein
VTNLYKGTRSRDEFVEKLSHIASRLQIEPRAVKVRPAPGSKIGLILSFTVQGQTISRSCDSQKTKDGNFACLTLWFEDLVRNVERRIERLDEAFRAEGMKELPASAGEEERYGRTRASYYRGDMSPKQAAARIEKALERLELSMGDCKVDWSDDPCRARMLLRLKSGRVVEKISERQETAAQNLAALALWLETRAKNYERGIEKDVDQLFAANLLPERSGE